VIDLDQANWSFSPSRTRYLIVGPFLAIEAVFFLTLLAGIAGGMADGVQSGVVLAIISLVFGAVIVSLCAFFTSYALNAATLRALFDQNNINIKTGYQSIVIPLSSVVKICYLDTFPQAGRGWMYIIIYTDRDIYTITNMMYFDKEFAQIRAHLRAWLKEIGKDGLVYEDSVTKITLLRNKKLPPFIYRGMWRSMLGYGFVLAVITYLCVITGVRPAVWVGRL